jgi:HSP20 family protein
MANMRGFLNDLAAIELQLAQLAEGPSLLPERGPGNWSPAVDIYETENDFVLTAEAPGLKSEEIDIQVIDRQLILRGERRWESEAHAEHFHRIESAYGKFERTFNLSEGIDVERITAELADGILRVVLPKRTTASGKQIEVKG